MKLIIVHFHFRPGGIRRIIELAVPHLIRGWPRPIQEIVLAGGEAGDRKWNVVFESVIKPVPCRLFIEPSFRYLSEQQDPGAHIRVRVRAACTRLLEGASRETALVWAHNLGIARNLILAAELARACAASGVVLVSHHHDWWFDNRWLRWPEMKRFGIRTLAAAAQSIFPPSPLVRHAAINSQDAAPLKEDLPGQSFWIPNLTTRAALPTAERCYEARAWLHSKLKDGNPPIWIMPCRLLRRKNIGEALLLARWLRPEAWLVTTGSASSADEQPYAARIAAAAHAHHWRLRLSVLEGDETRKPGVPELMAVSEAILLTSIQEGFGLPFIEAAAAKRPLIARSIPNIAPDLDRFGCLFPQIYPELWIAPQLFSWDEEASRQKLLYAHWRSLLPSACRGHLDRPFLLQRADQPQPIPFSRLTLSAQIEVLARPLRDSWLACLPVNPFLSRWKERASAQHLEVSPWPKHATEWLNGSSYANRLIQLASVKSDSPVSSRQAVQLQRKLIQQKLTTENLFPLLWATDT